MMRRAASAKSTVPASQNETIQQCCPEETGDRRSGPLSITCSCWLHAVSLVSQLRCPNEGRRTLRASRAPQQCAAFQGSSYIPRPGQAGAHTCSHLLTPAFLLQMAACQLLVVAASSLRQAESAIDTCSLTRLSMERGTSQASKST